ncbi:intracellular serine protease [Fusarium austroafricanum]|uniref:Intracellular serine protease n=1 Tax=Fusarium austroafricanum TaxID=2364996 RepID=A0A8H4K835_9HYPO|nr:intracellular serine protease [Fusarium austroafricanum]
MKTFDYRNDGVGILYILETTNSGESTVEAFSATSDIEATLEKKAIIISMSWTLPKPEEGTPKREKSQNETEHYPSYFDSKNIFLIGAADDSGALDNSDTRNDFIFPGVNASSCDHNQSTTTSLTKELTDSSIATALAAGLAAMMIYCFKASALADVMPRIEQRKVLAASSTELIKPEDIDVVAHHGGIKTMFERIGTIESSCTPFIPVWSRFRNLMDQ